MRAHYQCQILMKLLLRTKIMQNHQYSVEKWPCARWLPKCDLKVGTCHTFVKAKKY